MVKDYDLLSVELKGVLRRALLSISDHNQALKPMMIGTEPSWSHSEKSSTSGTTTSVAIEVDMETNAESNGLRIGDACDIELEGQSHPMMQTPVAPYALEQ